MNEKNIFPALKAYIYGWGWSLFQKYQAEQAYSLALTYTYRVWSSILGMSVQQAPLSYRMSCSISASNGEYPRWRFPSAAVNRVSYQILLKNSSPARLKLDYITSCESTRKIYKYLKGTPFGIGLHQSETELLRYTRRPAHPLSRLPRYNGYSPRDFPLLSPATVASIPPCGTGLSDQQHGLVNELCQRNPDLHSGMPHREQINAIDAQHDGHLLSSASGYNGYSPRDLPPLSPVTLASIPPYGTGLADPRHGLVDTRLTIPLGSCTMKLVDAVRILTFMTDQNDVRSIHLVQVSIYKILTWDQKPRS